jgi:hypothetical protein
MAATTNDERREVARKLREEGKIWASSRQNPEWYYNRIDRCLGNHGLTFEGLADLIDLPTCHVVSEALHTGGFGCEEAGTEFTLSCGHTVIVDGDFQPRYCDECGCRVVNDDED